MEIARWVWVGERERDQMGPDGRGVVCYVVEYWVLGVGSKVVDWSECVVSRLREINVGSAICPTSRQEYASTILPSYDPPRLIGIDGHNSPEHPSKPNRNDPLRTETHQNPPTPQTPLNKIPRIAAPREQPQFVKPGESGFVLRLRVSYICNRSFCR